MSFGINPKRETGVEIITDVNGKSVEHGMHKCCHAGGENCVGYWRLKPGSGIERGFCYNCGDFFCGLGCRPCVPHEKWLQEEAKRIDLFHKIANGG